MAVEEHDARFYPAGPTFPGLVSKERAVLPCGCYVAVGLRLDNREVTTGATPCSPGHTPLMERFNELMADSLEDPQDRLLVEVADELLEKAAEGVLT